MDRYLRLCGISCACVLGLLAALALMAPVAGWWYHAAATFAGRRTEWDGVDFSVFYAAGRLVATGHAHSILTLDALRGYEHAASPQLAELKHGDTLAYLNPPFFALLMAPLGRLGPERAFQVFTLINLALLAAACAMVWRIAAPLERRWRVLLMFAMVTAFPVPFALRLGQFSFVLLVSWTAAYLLLRQGRDRAAGLALAPMLIKPELIVPVVLFLAWKRRRGVFETLVPASLAAIVVSFAVVGAAEGLRYPLYVLEHAREHGPGTRTDIMFGWNGLIDMFFRSTNPGLATTLAVPAALATVAGASMGWRGTLRTGEPRFARQWLALSLATVLADPHLYPQDLMLLIPGAAATLAATSGRDRTLTACALACAWALLWPGVFTNLMWRINVFTPYMVLCTALVVRRLRLEARTSRDEAHEAAVEPLPALMRAA